MIRDLKYSVRRALLLLTVDEVARMTKQDLKYVSLGFLVQLEEQGYSVRFDVKPVEGAFDFMISDVDSDAFILVAVCLVDMAVTKDPECYDDYADLVMQPETLLKLRYVNHTVSDNLYQVHNEALEACQSLLREDHRSIYTTSEGYYTSILCVGRRVESTVVHRFILNVQ